jgi:uncharacterized membrane protein
MLATDNIMVIKTAAAATAITGSWGFFALADDIGSLPMQLTALGILGGAVLYVVVKIVPAAMKQRQEESTAFVKAIQTITEAQVQERIKWMETMHEHTVVLKEISEAVQNCPANRNPTKKG